MKKIKISIFFILFSMILLFSCSSSTKKVSIKENFNNNFIEREKVLKILSNKLNKMIPTYKSNYGKNKFYVRDGHSGQFHVVDLTDTLNISRAWEKINFKKGHVYYYCPNKYEYSISNLLYIDETGNLSFFQALNCDNGFKIENVLIELNERLQNDSKKNQTLDNVKNYRKFGKYIKSDQGSNIKCEDILLNQKVC